LETPPLVCVRQASFTSYFVLLPSASCVLLSADVRLPVPSDEGLDGLVLGQAELVVGLRGVAVSLLGPLPELALVDAREQGLVLLGFVLEDGLDLSAQTFRREN